MLRILTTLGSSRTFRLSKSSYRSFSGVKPENPRPEVPKEQESSFTIPLSFLTKDFIDLCGGKSKLEKKTTNQVYDEFLKPKFTPTIRSLQDVITSPQPTTSAASPVYYIHHDPNTPFLETIDQLTNYFNDINHESIQLLIDPFTNRLNQPETSLQEILTTNKQIITNYQNQLRTLILIPSNYSLIHLLSNRNFIFHLLQQTILKISNDKKQFLFPLQSTLQPYEILLQWEKKDLNFPNYLHLQKIIIQSLISDETLLTQPLTPPKPSFFPQQTPDEKLLLLKRFDDETSILFQFIQKEWQIPYSSLQSLYEKNIQQILLTSLRRHYTSTATHPIALLEGKLFLSQVEDLLPTQSSSNEAIRGGSSSGDSKSKSQKYMIQIKDLHYSVERLGKNHPLTQQLYLHHFPVVLNESQGLSDVEKYYNTFLDPILTSSQSSPPSKSSTDNLTSTRTVYPTQKVILALHEYGRCITERNIYIKKTPLLERFDWIEKYYHTLFTYIIPKLGQEHYDTMILIYSYLDYYHVLMNQYEESLVQNKGKSSSKKASNNNKKDQKNSPKSPQPPNTPTPPTSAEVEKLLLHLVKQMKEFYRDLPVSAAMIDSLLLLAKYYHLTANPSSPHKGSHKNKHPLPEKTIKIIDLILSNLDATLSQKQKISNYTFDSLMNVLNYLIAEGTMPCYEKAELLNWKILPLINHGQHLVEAVEAFSEISLSIDDINHEKLQSGGGEGVSALPQGSEYPALYPYHRVPVIPVEEVVAFLQERDRAHEEEERKKNGGRDVEKNPLHSVLNMIGRAYYQQGDYMMARQYFIAYKVELEEYKAQITAMIQAEEGTSEEKEEGNNNEEEQQQEDSEGKKKNEKKEEDKKNALKENQKKESFLSTEQLKELKDLLKELNFFLDHITISIFTSSIQLKDITTAHKDEFFHAYHHIKNNKMIKKEEYAISITLNRYFADSAIYYQQYREAYYFLDALYYLQSDYKKYKDNIKYRIIDSSNTCKSLGDVCYKLKDYKKSVMFYEEALALYEEIFGREEGEVEAVIKVKQMIEVVKKEMEEKKNINQKKQ